MIVSSATLERWLGHRRFALYGDLVQAVSGMLVVGVWCFVAIVTVRLASQTVDQPGRSDFTIFYYGARMVLDGLSPYGDLPASYGVSWQISHLGNLNPPHIPLLSAPLGLLTYVDAARAWIVASYLSATALVWATGRTIGAAWTLRRALVWGAAIMANVGFLSVAVTGEWTWFLAWPFWLAWRAARRGRWTEAGAWLGVCASAKLFFLVFLLLLGLVGRLRAGAAMLAAGVATAASALVVYPPAVFGEWIRTLGIVSWWWLPMNLSWRGTVARTFARSREYPNSLELASWVDPLTAVGVLAIAGGIAVWAVRGRARIDADQLFAVGLLASLIMSPLGWVYYLPLAVPPLLGLAWTGRLARLGGPALWALAAGLAGLYVPFEWVKAAGSGSWIGAATTGSLYGWSSLLVLGAVLAVRPAPPRAVSTPEP